MAACYLKLEDWKAAVDCASACVEGLERVIPSLSEKDEGEKKKDADDSAGEDTAVVEISDNDEISEEEQLRKLKEADERKRDVARIRAKALMRHARAKTELGGWGNLQGAEEDYKLLAGMENLSADDKKIVQKALRELPARIGKAREAEMGEMMGKLKDVSISSPPFGEFYY